MNISSMLISVNSGSVVSLRTIVIKMIVKELIIDCKSMASKRMMILMNEGSYPQAVKISFLHQNF